MCAVGGIVRLLISGYYGFENFGDEALLAALLANLRDYDVTVLSGHPEATTDMHGVPAVHRYRGALGAIARTDALIFGGGGLLQDRTSRRSLAYYTALIHAAKLFRKQVVLLGQSLGPLTSRGEQQVKRAVTGVPLGVRDEQSFTLAKRLSLTPTYTPDIALTLPTPSDLHRPNGPVVIVPRADQVEFTALLQRVIPSLTQSGVAVIGAAFQPSDATSALGIEVPVITSPREWHALLAGASLVLSVRLHGVVLALSAGIPAVALSYDPKVAGFAEYAGVPWFAADADGATVVNSVQKARVAAFSRAGELARDAGRGFAWLHEQLTNTHSKGVH